MNRHNLWFLVLAGCAVAFLVASFLVPPTGTIDPSVLKGVGELFAFASLATVLKAIDKDATVTLSHGDTSVTVDNDDDE